MLSSLRIQNLALVEDLALDFQDGFTVLTGETGAGKSLLVDALSLLVGARGDGDMVRQGTARAVAEAVVDGAFEAWRTLLVDRGLPEEQPVVLRREVGANGRSRAWINGGACSLADLREAGRIWMRLTSQHDHQSLLAEDRHLGLLDEVLGVRTDLSAQAGEVREAQARLAARKKSESQRAERLEWLAEQIADLEKLAPRTGEWLQLRNEREPLRHAVHLEAAFREGAEALREALRLVEDAHRAQARAAAILPAAQVEVDRTRSALLELEDIQALAQDQAIRWSREGVDRIEALETRLAQFEKLARRHRCEPEELAGRLEALRREQDELNNHSSSLRDLEAGLAKACAAYLEAAGALHAHRAGLVPPLEKDVHQRLGRLGMGGCRIQLRLSVAEEPASPVLLSGLPVKVSPQGYSSVVIWIEPNVGEGFRPLAKVASGGELSRLMLAMQGAGMALGAGHRDPLVLVLDEVDAGIGGETAIAVGAAVRELGRSHQVLAVTHLAQVAARAQHHGQLRKEVSDGRTRSGLTWLAGDPRVRELARLLSGHPDRPEAVAHARILLEGAVAAPLLDLDEAAPGAGKRKRTGAGK
ncbi:DNA repair protein RecN [Mesoterricola silvestris]|uniref:DNA repair protein RecN n=1 Tax=Mesoterricola silvestris TaxID=2927979 RepID=A0AA48K7F3_9BACT|nr:DNA repair protein RecN [Mesoterricola silvestris]BDU71046.1 DNA repair protein RecN [Mesoterricola silvestris]